MVQYMSVCLTATAQQLELVLYMSVYLTARNTMSEVNSDPTHHHPHLSILVVIEVLGIVSPPSPLTPPPPPLHTHPPQISVPCQYLSGDNSLSKSNEWAYCIISLCGCKLLKMKTKTKQKHGRWTEHPHDMSSRIQFDFSLGVQAATIVILIILLLLCGTCFCVFLSGCKFSSHAEKWTQDLQREHEWRSIAGLTAGSGIKMINLEQFVSRFMV